MIDFKKRPDLFPKMSKTEFKDCVFAFINLLVMILAIGFMASLCLGI